MVASLLPDLGIQSMSVTMDDEWHREYKVTYRVLVEPGDGPHAALNCPGLPAVGAYWLVDNDADLWAYRTPETTATPVRTAEPNDFYDVELTFSTRPVSARRCSETEIEDPLLQPPKISGSGIRYTEEATRDRFGAPIRTSSHEPIRGPQVEFPHSRPQVTIEMNVASLNVGYVQQFENCVNASAMWGLPRRCVMLTSFTWEQLYYATCYRYFRVTLVFDLDRRGFDRDLTDEGTKALNGRWSDSTESAEWVLEDIDGLPPNPKNPSHFKRFIDRNGNPSSVILDNGVPFNPGDDVTTCLPCSAEGMPERLLVDLGTESIELTHGAGDCEWLNAEHERSPSLGYEGGEWVFALAATADEEFAQWVASGLTWNCRDSNVMALASGDGPLTVGVSAYMPAPIHVEKHPEREFLLLGIPPVL